jgi:RNA polymerase sigma-70 factor (ECF subfamily)
MSPVSPARTAEGAMNPQRPDEAEARRLVATHLDTVWRFLLGLGVPAADVADAAQETLFTAYRNRERMQPGHERGFLRGIAARVAMHARRSLYRRRETGDEALDALPDHRPSPEDINDQRRAAALLDRVLATLPFDLRTVFVLFEIEDLTTPEIAHELGIPLGTAASRLRRAREAFREGLERAQPTSVLPRPR